eukprot:Nitzschia sp. Nitz4//scaffold48_size128905//76044//78126//NITZ4_003604-RA/size128905-augustus-gene-0.10-mRNA-1//1//CDS//3329552994//2221//frame0
MSYVARSTQQPPPQQAPFDTSAKKKFGKNLNKLTKPPQPATDSGSRHNANSRNGLLLLSTKRQPTASTGGILSTKSGPSVPAKPLPSLGLQNQSSPSTHDALLGAVVGASRTEANQHDAWGVADKPKGSEPPDDHAPAMDSSRSPSNTPGGDVATPRQESLVDSVPTHNPELPSSNWDEYGGRNVRPAGSSNLYTPDSATPGQDQAFGDASMRATGTSSRTEDGHRVRDMEDRMSGAGEYSRQANGATARALFDPKRSNRSHDDDAGVPDPVVPSDTKVDGRQPIQLVSYDDRDRGERGNAAGPRMLYDPKSGAMVAVSSRDDGVNARGGRKDRTKKAKNPREKEVKGDLDGIKGGPRKVKRDKRGEVVSPSKVDARKGKFSSARQFPRSTGVLYSRDAKGSFVSVDGCDGDLGYGAHSVPGGRIKNSDAFADYLENKRNAGAEEAPEGLHTSTTDAKLQASEDEMATLQTGFALPEPVLEVKFDWLKPSDKIELVTGVDDSPTLQATAKAWAPSQAALAAAAAHVDQEPSSDQEGPKPTPTDTSDDYEDDGAFGLGFDPTLNMNSVMESPADLANGLDTVDLTSLSLQSAFNASPQTNNIFAFGTGSTWGSSDAGGSSGNWAIPASSNPAAGFLSLPAGNAWGGVPGLGGSALSTTPLNQENAGATGD